MYTWCHRATAIKVCFLICNELETSVSDRESKGKVKITYGNMEIVNEFAKLQDKAYSAMRSALHAEIEEDTPFLRMGGNDSMFRQLKRLYNNHTCGYFIDAFAVMTDRDIRVTFIYNLQGISYFIREPWNHRLFVLEYKQKNYTNVQNSFYSYDFYNHLEFRIPIIDLSLFNIDEGITVTIYNTLQRIAYKDISISIERAPAVKGDLVVAAVVTPNITIHALQYWTSFYFKRGVSHIILYMTSYRASVQETFVELVTANKMTIYPWYWSELFGSVYNTLSSLMISCYAHSELFYHMVAFIPVEDYLDYRNMDNLYSRLDTIMKDHRVMGLRFTPIVAVSRSASSLESMYRSNTIFASFNLQCKERKTSARFVMSTKAQFKMITNEMKGASVCDVLGTESSLLSLSTGPCSSVSAIVVPKSLDVIISNYKRELF